MSLAACSSTDMECIRILDSAVGQLTPRHSTNTIECSLMNEEAFYASTLVVSACETAILLAKCDSISNQ